MQKVKIVVESVRGECAAGCKPGDVFYYEDGSIYVDDASVRLCAYGLSSIIPYLSGFVRAGESEDWIGSVEELQCPDAANTVLYRLEKVK